MFGRTLIWLLCYSFLFVLPAAAQQRAIRPVDQIPSPSNKQALVIGNSAYEHTSLLRNPANDSKEIAKMFPTYVGMNRGRETLGIGVEYVPHIRGDEP